MKNKLRIAIIEDNKAYAKALSFALNTYSELEVTHVLYNALRVEKDFLVNTPDVVLVDINLPGITGIEAVKIITNNFESTKCLMLTSFVDLDKIIASIKNGAKGYLVKNNDGFDKIVESVKLIHSELFNESFPINGPLAKKMLDALAWQHKTMDEKMEKFELTPRQCEILMCLYEGDTYKLIAEKLSISYETVITHVKNIYTKMSIHSRYQIRRLLDGY